MGTKDFLDYLAEQSKNKPTIFCDMDGVLVDIIAGVAKLYNIPNLGNNNFDTIIDPMKKQIDKEHPNMFAKLPWTNDGKKLWNYISKHKVEILSAHTTSWQPSSKADKLKWIEKHLHPKPHFSNIVLRDQKKDHAMVNGVKNILIDDWSKNIKEWESAGGIGIKHTSTAETIAALKKLGM
jgi:5'(3')-deoxyribonucleotidase